MSFSRFLSWGGWDAWGIGERDLSEELDELLEEEEDPEPPDLLQ